MQAIEHDAEWRRDRSEAVKVRQILNLRKDLIKSADKWRHANEFPSRSEAIDWLIEYALAQKPKVDRPA